MNKFLLLFFVCIYYSTGNLPAGDLPLLVSNDFIEISFISNLRYTQNEGKDIATVNGAIGYSFGPIERTKTSYSLYLYGLGISYHPTSKWTYGLAYLISPLDTTVGYTHPGSRDIYYKIMDFTSTILSVKRKFVLQDNLDISFGGGIVHNVVYTDASGFGYNMIRNNYRTIILQCEINRIIYKRLRVGLGLNYEFKDDITIEEYYSWQNSSFKISPLSLNLNMSLAL